MPYGRIVGYTGPQWRRDAKSEIKGWGVRTCIVDKVMDRDGEVNECVIRTFNAAAECKDFTVFAPPIKSIIFLRFNIRVTVI